MSLQHSPLQYGLATLLLLVPNIAFAHTVEWLWYLLTFSLLILAIIIFIIIFCYFANKYGWSTVRKIAQILLSWLFYVCIFTSILWIWESFWGMLSVNGLTISSEWFWIFYYLIWFILLCIFLSFAPKLACKIIK